MLAEEVRSVVKAGAPCVSGLCAVCDSSSVIFCVMQDAKRWHPPGYVPGVTVDGSTLVATLHWVHCNYAGKPSWAHSDAVSAGFKVCLVQGCGGGFIYAYTCLLIPLHTLRKAAIMPFE